MDDDLQWLIPLKFIAPPPGSVLPVVTRNTYCPPFTTAPPKHLCPPSGADLTGSPTATRVAGAQPELVEAGRWMMDTCSWRRSNETPTEAFHIALE
jgi:hypothetical protein